MKDRRTFLKNTALGALSIGLTSKITKGAIDESGNEASLMCNPTTLDYYGEGPFYTDNPPLIEEGQLAGPDDPGTKMIISGRVFNIDCNEYIPNTVVDVWHADSDGEYDNQGFSFRGYTNTNDQGFYLFETIKPGKYLNGNSFRPSHIHYKITPPGFPTLTTQLYFEGDTSIDGDAAASISSGNFNATDRIIPLAMNSDGVLEGTFDIIIDGDGISVGTQDLHLDKGMIYKASPNPFSSHVEIEYGVFKNANVGLIVYDLNGRQIATLQDQQMSAEKYISVWEPEADLPKGHYFIVLRVNGLQVHHFKVLKG